MSTHTYPRWGRVDRHRIQHAWRPFHLNDPDFITLWPECHEVDNYEPERIDFDSDAARCERCAARIARGAA